MAAYLHLIRYFQQQCRWVLEAADWGPIFEKKSAQRCDGVMFLQPGTQAAAAAAVYCASTDRQPGKMKPAQQTSSALANIAKYQ